MAGADPGFPRGGGDNFSGRGGVPTYEFAKISGKLNEIERIWMPGGGGHTPRAPPPKSANGWGCIMDTLPDCCSNAKPVNLM